MPSERLAAGADIVTFSGDKLVGGPQAGLIVGRADLVARMRRDPLARATRPDKATLAADAATLGLYRAGRAVEAIPVWSMIAMPSAAIQARAEAVSAALGGAPVAEVIAVASTVGGGSLPGETLPSFAVALQARSATQLVSALRRGDPAVVGRIAEGRVILDLRTVDPGDDERLTSAIKAALEAPA
jgi:L-seryl-tRNA(Ser) seleniumtransferase